MDVFEVLGRVVAVDPASAGIDVVRAGLVDAGRVRSWLESWEIGAKRRLGGYPQVCVSGVA
jgi:hypothetical protein